MARGNTTSKGIRTRPAPLGRRACKLRGCYFEFKVSRYLEYSRLYSSYKTVEWVPHESMGIGYGMLHDLADCLHLLRPEVLEIRARSIACRPPRGLGF